MSTKSMIVVGASALVLSASLVFNGVAHLRAASSTAPAPATQLSSQTLSAATPEAKAANATDPNIAVQPASTTADTASAAADPAKDNTLDGSATQTDDATATTGDSASVDAAEPIVVPDGTTLTARLSETLGSKISQKGQAFAATLDQDVVVDGQTAIPAGASIIGKVVSANPAGKFAGEAALDIRLTSINVSNVDLPLMTSIQAFGPRIKEKNKVGKIMIGLAKRAEGDEKEVVLASQSAYSFTLKQDLEIQ